MCLFTVYVIGKISGYSSLLVAGELIVIHRFSTVQGVSSNPLIKSQLYMYLKSNFLAFSDFLKMSSIKGKSLFLMTGDILGSQNVIYEVDDVIF